MSDTPPAVPPNPVGRTRSRPGMAVACALLVLGVGAAVLWGTGSGGPAARADLVRSTSRFPSAPVPLAQDSEYVDTEVLEGGDLVVTHWIRTSLPMDRLTLALPAASGLVDETWEVQDLVVAADGVQAATPDPDVSDAGWAAVLPAARGLYVQYRLVGVAQRSGSADGRALATVTSLTLGVGGQPLARTQTFSGSKVLTLACLAPGARATPSLCGRLVNDTWTLDFAAGAVPATVIAQLDLDGSHRER